MRVKCLRMASAVALLSLLLMLSGCTLTFTLEGADSYTITADGRVLDGSFNESEIEMELTTKGFMLKLPVVLEVELEGLIMSMSMSQPEIDAALATIGEHLETGLGFEDHTFDTSADTFRVTGEYTLLDFWTALGISSAGPMLGPIPIPLKLIIGQAAYDGFVDSIVQAANMIGDGSTIDFEFQGFLKTALGKTVGTFTLWFDALNPV
ncbi:MAG TPA: hypothetical protein PLT03_05555 [Bacillota bacterium]|nr:hypothetical protein [Bacillota bacterium]HOA15819.1 hypothetical protein [Bacillota bacterium]HOG53319.1 hypothetical protein [Bacillota bacterium]